MSRYQGRTYDTCISLGNMGEPWCPTSLDEEGNYIEGQREICGPECDVNDCPIGFYRQFGQECDVILGENDLVILI